MKIITVNIPTQYVEKIKRYVGDNGLYPSRSELVRVAIRDFLLKELKIVEKKPVKIKKIAFSEAGYVSVPIEVKVGDCITKDVKRYKIINRMEKFAK